MSPRPLLRRELLAQAFGGNPVLIHAFEQQAEMVEQTSETAAAANDTTSSMQAASVLTLSANDVFENERILTADAGIEFEDDGSLLKVRVTGVPLIEGGQDVTFLTTGATALILPKTGTLSTTAGTETLTNKTLAAPKLSGLGDHADDTAAATGGVPIGGVYRTGSALKVRVA